MNSDNFLKTILWVAPSGEEHLHDLPFAQLDRHINIEMLDEISADEISDFFAMLLFKGQLFSVDQSGNRVPVPIRAPFLIRKARIIDTWTNIRRYTHRYDYQICSSLKKTADMLLEMDAGDSNRLNAELYSIICAVIQPTGIRLRKFESDGKECSVELYTTAPYSEIITPELLESISYRSQWCCGRQGTAVQNRKEFDLRWSNQCRRSRIYQGALRWILQNGYIITKSFDNWQCFFGLQQSKEYWTTYETTDVTVGSCAFEKNYKDATRKLADICFEIEKTIDGVLSKKLQYTRKIEADRSNENILLKNLVLQYCQNNYPEFFDVHLFSLDWL